MTRQDVANPPAGKGPTALFVASGHAPTVTSHLHTAARLGAASCPPVRLKVKTPTRTGEIAACLRSPVDLVVFDGHGYLPPRVGTLALDPGSIRDDDGHGIVAPVVVFPRVVRLLAELGPSPSARNFHDGLSALLDELTGQTSGWTAQILPRRARSSRRSRQPAPDC
jgi:hypothetical protein